MWFQCSDPLVGSQQFLLEVVGKELSATAVGEDKAVILKALRLKVVLCHLTKECFHVFNLLVFFSP
jgi:hypothetical protein